MRLAAGLAVLLAVVPLAARAASPDASLGTVVKSGSGTCLRIARPGLAAGAPITVIVLDQPQSLAGFAVIGTGPDCADAKGVNGYRLRAVTGAMPDDLVAIGTTAPAADLTLKAGKASLRLEGEPDFVTFRSCTSSDGVHVTAWAGAKRRVWHAYVYLGQDLDATCTPAESTQE